MKISPWVTIAAQRRAFVVAVIAAFAAFATLAVPCSAAADDYPSHAVKIVVPFAAGGPADIYARFIAQRLEQA